MQNSGCATMLNSEVLGLPPSICIRMPLILPSATQAAAGSIAPVQPKYLTRGTRVLLGVVKGPCSIALGPESLKRSTVQCCTYL